MNEYAEIYDTVWAYPQYSNFSPEVGDNHFIECMLKLLKANKVLSIGCGNGAGVRELLKSGYDAHGIDVSKYAIGLANKLTEGALGEPSRYRCLNVLSWTWSHTEDWQAFICIDVMEHIAQEDVSLFLNRLSAAKVPVVFSIALGKDAFGPKILGKPLHLTIKQLEWWKGALSMYWKTEAYQSSRKWAVSFLCLPYNYDKGEKIHGEAS